MAKMRYYTFFNVDSDFNHILQDAVIKKSIALKISWVQHLMIGLRKREKDKTLDSYISLKYSDSMVTDLIKDFSPKAGIDYYLQ